MPRGGLHHVELWVPDLERAVASFGWLLAELGYASRKSWPGGESFCHGDCYLVLEESTALSGPLHDRLAPGLNHLTFHAGSEAEVDRLSAASAAHGWRPLFEQRYPSAGGEGHYAAYLENSDGFEVELVAS